MTTDRPSSIVLGDVVLDTDDPPALAEFYAALLGWEVIRCEEDWWSIGSGSGPRLLDPSGHPFCLCAV